MANRASEFFLSCWHAAGYESAALWRLYGGVSDGVAVRTTTGKLVGNLRTGPKEDIYAGTVRYLDFEISLDDLGDLFPPYFRKRLSFQHENEVRLMHWAPIFPTEPHTSMSTDFSNPAPVISFEIDPSAVIEEVLISPYLASWAVAPIAKAIAALGCTAPVRQSDLLTVRQAKAGLRGASTVGFGAVTA